MANSNSQLYFVGGGIASLSGAIFAIRDGNIIGENIYIFDSSKTLGGALDGIGDPQKGYTALGARKYDRTPESYACLYDLMKTIPGMENRGLNLYEEFIEWNDLYPKYTKARLLDKSKNAIRVLDTQLNKSDVLKISELVFIPESMIEKRTIDSWFSDSFFKTNFWFGFSTMFGFKYYHDLIEMKRYLRKFAHSFQNMKSDGTQPNPIEVTHAINQYESLIHPIKLWLAGKGVHFLFETSVTDLDFESGDKITVKTIHYTQSGESKSIEINTDDKVFVTNGSKVADHTYGTMKTPAPKPDKTRLHPSWQLWKNIAEKHPGKLGNPHNFYSHVEQSEWVWYCVTTKDPLFFELFEKKTGNAPGESDCVTSGFSPWCINVQVPAQPHFLNQPKDVYFWMGYGLYSNEIGEYVKKPMNDCTGEEILTEIVYQYGFEEHLEQILANSNCIPIYEPYVTSQFLSRKENDRPKVIPEGSTNLGFLGQFVECGECVYLVELSVRTGMEAVYSLLKLDKKPLPLFRGIDHPKNIINLISVMSK